MAYINLPPSLQALIDGIVQRLTKLENGQRFTLPNVPILTSQPTVTGLITGDPTTPRAGDAWLNTTSNAPRYVDATGLAQNLSNPSPTGSMVAFGGATAPTGWLLCDGAAISRTTYSALFATLSTNYGVGDGSTTFNIPNLQGRFPVGKDGSAEFATLGQSGGNKTHSHTLSNTGYAKVARANNRVVIEETTATSWTGNNEVTGTGAAASSARTTGAGLGGSTDATTGAGAIPPYQVVNYIIKI